MNQSHVTVKQLIARMQNEKNFPAISRHITELNSKASPTGESSASELAALILRDYSLTSRLLKVANSAMYGQFSGTISTVSRAVVVLGFEQVQLTAAGLIFFEHLQDKSKSHYIKEAVLSAFISGILARDLAKNMDIKGWENFYIGAMFHNFGRLLTMYYFQQEFDVYQQLLAAGDLDEETAARRALGVSFADLGIGVANSWGLPEQIVVSMKSPQEGERKEEGKKVKHHQLLPRFANELCDITMNVPPNKRHEHLTKLLEKYRKPYPVRQNEIVNIMDAAIKEMQKFTEVLRLDRTDLARLDRRSFNATEEPPVTSEQQAAVIPHKFEITDPDQPPHRLTTAEERKQHLQGGIQEITNVMLDDFTLDEILSMILETIYRGIGFNRLVIFFKDPRSDKMQARYGLGPNTAEIVENFSFPIDSNVKDLFNTALSGNKDLYIGNISDIEIREFKPAWFIGSIFSPSLAIYPIVINQKRIGLIYGGHDEAGEHLDREQLNAMKTLRNQAALAIKQSFTGS
ncbi:MAG: HDOD domain-containing protein [Desulfuromonadales bacterium]|nr:HDOD domain-containing protein [Desulfuromonadales bacterium]